MKTRSLLMPALATLLLGACASDYHYSQLIDHRYFKVPIHTYNVTVLRIDGKETTRRPALIEPGRHVIEVQGPPGGAGGFGEVRPLALDVAPCTRYYLAAEKVNALESDFRVLVDYQEPVAGCTPPPAG